MIVYELEHTQHRKCCVRYVTDRIIIMGYFLFFTQVEQVQVLLNTFRIVNSSMLIRPKGLYTII